MSLGLIALSQRLDELYVTEEDGWSREDDGD